jgi:gamma-glutamyltranspeptidase/glutathione hydrolase
LQLALTRREFLAATAAAAATPIRSADGPVKAIVTGQPEGAAAGNSVLAAGGNAVDAAVAAALVAGVVALPSTGIGGYGGHLVVARPGGKVAAIDFNSTAPAAATPDMFHADENGLVKNRVNSHGWLAAGVPGVLAGLQLALDRFGTKSFAEVVKPAIRFAREGFLVSKSLAASFVAAKAQFARDPGSAKLFLPDGKPLATGATYRNPGLADMLTTLAEKGRVDAFYSGEIAETIAAAFKKNGGLLTAADLAAYRPVEVEPLAVDCRGHVVHTPPPTAGGLTVLQALACLRELEWGQADPDDPSVLQTRVEVLRLAWADRLRFLGDPKFVDVPVSRLLSADYAKANAVRVRAAVKAGEPVETKSDGRPAGGTIHLTAADAAGTLVALTFTHGEAFGAQVTVEGLGLVLGHGISRFDPGPGRANSIAPGKRPLHNMCPTVVTKAGVPVMAVGATGGRRIPNTLFDVLSYRLFAGRSLVEAVKAPRLHTEGGLALTLEAAWPAPVKDHFKAIGYEVKTGPGANLNAIERDPTSGELRTAAR